MILTGREIEKQVAKNRIRIFPFDSRKITTNSYDLKLGTNILKYTSKIIDPTRKSNFEIIKIPQEGLLMKKGDFLLGSTDEKVGSNFYVPIIHAKSSIARMGLFIHITADIIDIGSFGNLTLQMFATLPIRLYPNMLIAQVSFWVPRGKIILYNGKYQGSDGPMPSLGYMDFGKKIKRNVGTK